MDLSGWLGLNSTSKGKSFWCSDFSNTGSWIWKQLLNLRTTAQPHISCQLGNGKKTSFWLDNWTGLGSLLDLVGSTGPQVSGIQLLASVSEVVGPDGWMVPRGRHPLLCFLCSCLPQQTLVITSLDYDLYLWRKSITDPPSTFSVSKTHKALNPDPPTVPWHSEVWFKEKIPKHAFISWTVMWQRLPTRDKLAYWGINVPPHCLLCGTGFETSDHIFFSCSYSTEVWSSFFTHSALIPPPIFADVISWLKSITSTRKIKAIVKLIFQRCIYFLWRERNSRIHSSVLKPLHVTQREIQMQIRARLLGLDQESYKTLVFFYWPSILSIALV